MLTDYTKYKNCENRSIEGYVHCRFIYTAFSLCTLHFLSTHVVYDTNFQNIDKNVLVKLKYQF